MASIAVVYGERCRTYGLREVLAKVVRSQQPCVGVVVRSIVDQPGRGEAEAKDLRVTEAQSAKLPDAAEHLEADAEDLLAFRHVRLGDRAPDPRVRGRQQRVTKEIQRRTDVVGVVPDRAASIRLVGVVAHRRDR